MLSPNLLESFNPNRAGKGVGGSILGFDFVVSLLLFPNPIQPLFCLYIFYFKNMDLNHKIKTNLLGRIHQR